MLVAVGRGVLLACEQVALPDIFLGSFELKGRRSELFGRRAPNVCRSFHESECLSLRQCFSFWRGLGPRRVSHHVRGSTRRGPALRRLFRPLMGDSPARRRVLVFDLLS